MFDIQVTNIYHLRSRFTVLALQSNRKVVFDYFLGVCLIYFHFLFSCIPPPPLLFVVVVVVVVKRQTAKGCKTT